MLLCFEIIYLKKKANQNLSSAEIFFLEISLLVFFKSNVRNSTVYDSFTETILGFRCAMYENIKLY